MIALRRQMAREGVPLRPDGSHATYDRQVVRDRVFDLLANHDFTIDATVLDKPKTLPCVRVDQTYFYQLAWCLHFKHLARSFGPDDELLVIAAELKTNRRREATYRAMRNVVQQGSPAGGFQTAFWPASTDPCLQVADYCCWSIQRKWERDDGRSYVLIKSKIRSAFDVFASSPTIFY